jgi:hypothetical protein
MVYTYTHTYAHIHIYTHIYTYICINMYMCVYIYIYIYEFYAAIRKNKTMWLEGKWMPSEDIMLSEVGQVQKENDLIFSFICER